MKNLFLALVLTAVFSQIVLADVQVNGYMRRDGTFVAPYYRTTPNNTYADNYSTSGNYNPYTGNTGNVNYNYTPPINNNMPNNYNNINRALPKSDPSMFRLP